MTAAISVSLCFLSVARASAASALTIVFSSSLLGTQARKNVSFFYSEINCFVNLSFEADGWNFLNPNDFVSLVHRFAASIFGLEILLRYSLSHGAVLAWLSDDPTFHRLAASIAAMLYSD